jgi:hypothetical protein
VRLVAGVVGEDGRDDGRKAAGDYAGSVEILTAHCERNRYARLAFANHH